MNGPGHHQTLRTATAACHSRLDALFGRFDLTDREGYGRFLRAHAAVVPALETTLDQAGLPALLADWPRRRRAAQLLDDLAELGVAAPAAPVSALPASTAAVWGAAYVLEGSRLGGAVLVRSLAPGVPRRYLGAAQPPAAWPQFLRQLDAALDSPAALQQAIDAAQAVFGRFEAAGRREMESALSV